MNKKQIFNTIAFCMISLFAIPAAANMNTHKIKFTFDRYSCFPKSWYRGYSKAHTEMFDQKYTSNILKAYRAFKKEYPPAMLRHDLGKVYIFKELVFYNRSFGASYTGNNILIRHNPEKYGDYVGWTIGELHHEFSSILLNKYSHLFPHSKWKSANRGSYWSKRWGLEQLGNGSGMWGNKSLYKKGFVTKYGGADFENDVNVYAQFLFQTPRKLAKLGKKYPPIAQKTQLLKGFYCKINRDFNFCN